MAGDWFNNRYRSRTAPPAPAQGRKQMLTDEKKKVIRETVGKALDARVEKLAHWLTLSPECRTDFPNGHFADIAQALGLLKSLDEAPAAPAPAPLAMPALTAVQTLREYATRFGYVYKATAVTGRQTGVRVSVAKSEEAPDFYSSDILRETEEQAAAALLATFRVRV